MMDGKKIPEDKIRWLTWEVFGFGLTSFLSDLGHEVATTLLPLFLASLGAPAYAVGLIEGVADGAANLAKLLGGWLSDRLGRRKPLAAAGYALTALTQGLFGLVGAWPGVLLLRTVGWMGRGWRGPIRDALFHESVSRETSGRAFGFERAMDTLGAVIAPLAAFAFFSKIGFRNLFFITWIPGFLCVVCFLVFVRERKVAVSKSFSLVQGLRDFPPEYRRFLAAVTLFGLADFSHTLLIYWAGVLMAPAVGMAKAAQTAILLYAFHNVIYALASYPVGRLADRVGKIPVLAAGYAAAGAMFLALAFARPNVGFLAFIFFLAGFSVAVQDTLERALAGDLLPARIKGTGYGVLASLNGVGDLISSFMVGFLLSVGSPAAAFGTCFVLALLGVFFLWASRRRPAGS